MNRLHQLKETLIRNIEDNKAYQNLEFLVLDYNSQDGMETWAKENLSAYIKSGIVTYFKTIGPKTWSPSHSKNMAFKLATGDIVCNIWADYFTGENFAEFVNNTFQSESNIVMTPIDFHKTRMDFHPPGDVLGRVCVRKSDFFRVNGFDERMDKHGFEDYDFVNRLELLNVKRVLIDNFTYLGFIPHADTERYTLQFEGFEGLYVCYINPSKSDCILFFKNGLFQRGVLIDNHSINSGDYKNSFSRKKFLYQFSVESDWHSGAWDSIENAIQFHYSGSDIAETMIFDPDSTKLVSKLSGQFFYKVQSEEIVTGLLRFKHFYHTRAIMEDNLFNKRIIVNNFGFGAGTVFKNFGEHPISV
jgi:hypothetical protein